MTSLKTELLFDLTGSINTDVHDIGDGGRGQRMIVEVTGGTFEGPHLRGQVLPFGADWVVTRSDGVWALDVRIYPAN